MGQKSCHVSWFWVQGVSSELNPIFSSSFFFSSCYSNASSPTSCWWSWWSRWSWWSLWSWWSRWSWWWQRGCGEGWRMPGSQAAKLRNHDPSPQLNCQRYHCKIFFIRLMIAMKNFFSFELSPNHCKSPPPFLLSNIAQNVQKICACS